jgi:hypothetical protein
MQISYRYQSTDLEMDDWRMWRHEWFSLVIALKICIISGSAKRAIKGMFIPLYVSLITWKWKSNYFYSILEVFHKVLGKIKNRVICPLSLCIIRVITKLPNSEQSCVCNGCINYIRHWFPLHSIGETYALFNFIHLHLH